MARTSLIDKVHSGDGPLLVAFVFAGLLAMTVAYVDYQTPTHETRHISQAEAADQCESHGANSEETATEEHGDGSVGITEKPKPDMLARIQQRFGFTPPARHGHDAVAAMQAIIAGRSKVLISLGGNLAVAMPDGPACFAGIRGVYGRRGRAAGPLTPSSPGRVRSRSDPGRWAPRPPRRPARTAWRATPDGPRPDARSHTARRPAPG